MYLSQNLYFPFLGDQRVLDDGLLNFYANRKNTKMDMHGDNVIENKIQKILASISLDISIINPKYNAISNAKDPSRYWRFYYLFTLSYYRMRLIDNFGPAWHDPATKG